MTITFRFDLRRNKGRGKLSRAKRKLRMTRPSMARVVVTTTWGKEPAVDVNMVPGVRRAEFVRALNATRHQHGMSAW